MGDKLIRESLDEYAALNMPPETDLWPRLASQAHAATARTRTGMRPWIPGRETERTGLNMGNNWGRDTHRQRSGKRAFLATAFTSLATLLLVVLGTLGLLSFMSFAPNMGAGRPDSGTVAIVPPEPTATPLVPENKLEAPEDKASVPSQSEPPRIPPGEFVPSAPNLEYVERLGTELDLSHTLGDYTVALQRAYADANQIVLVYTVSGPDKGFTGVSGASLTDTNSSTDFPLMFNYVAMKDAQPRAFAVYFDASALDRLPDELNLRLSLSLSKRANLDFDLPALPGVDEESSFSEIRHRQVVSRTHRLVPEDLFFPAGREIVAGPFEFNFTVPVSTAETRIARVDQSAEAGGVKITLDKVVVTPGEARLTFSVDAPPGDDTVWQPVLALQAGDYNSQDTSHDLRVESSTSDGDGTWTYSVIAPLADKQGEWTVTISELRAGRDPDFGGLDLEDRDTRGPREQNTLSGPWVFKFTVPPAQP